MVPAKLLVGSVVAVGSVSTAAVVAHQQGFFSLPGSQTRSSDSAPNADAPAASQAETSPVTNEKPNQKEVKTWLTNNSNSEGWKIQIRKSGGTDAKGFEDESINETDLDGLKEYLSAGEREALLKDLFSALESKTLTFTKDGGSWKYLLTKDLIDAWVNKTSGSKATLKFRNGDDDTTLENLSSEFEAIFKCLRDNEKLFSDLKSNTSINSKVFAFKKDESNWKHIKQAIKDWLSSIEKEGSKFSITVQEGNTDIDGTNDDKLIGLLKYLKDNKDTLTNLIKDSQPTSLTFKKETNWEVIYSETTINNWVKNKKGDQTTLKRYKDGQETTPTTNEEWKALLEAIKTETSISSNSETARTIVFEQIDSTNWKHIKAAIKGWLASAEGGSDKLKVQIKKESADALDWDNSGFKDEDWVGLLKHLKDNASTYVPKPQEGQSDVADKTIKLQKNSTSNNWEQASS